MMPLVQAYIDQVPAGVHAPAPPAPPASAVATAPRSAGAAPPPGLYVRVAAGLTPPDAVRAGMEFVQRAGSDAPPFVRGLAVRDGGEPRVALFAGPFADRIAAEGFCARMLTGAVCVVQAFQGPPRGGPG